VEHCIILQAMALMHGWLLLTRMVISPLRAPQQELTPQLSRLTNKLTNVTPALRLRAPAGFLFPPTRKPPADDNQPLREFFFLAVEIRCSFTRKRRVFVCHYSFFIRYNNCMQIKNIQAICRRYPIKRLRLFGSRARGKAKRGSDYDFIVDYNEDYLPTLLDLGQLHSDLTKKLKAPVDILSNSKRLSKKFLKDAKTIYERN
jgi:predicted nucleotidyltransferase